ncbi:Retrotransposon-derived protein peg10 [Thalictrum thalictroides]|uniref:Retrotransposon-derived protein peg10 n=1 Tax=Thalictrum thalictroides TaxID=46969 RepID=A0A7J6WX95_THATH|nr:Retrotransposon-derived protein peg10 [Thalictrum thalictroides]
MTETTTEQWEMMYGLLETIHAQEIGTSPPIPSKTPLQIQLCCTDAFVRGKLATRNSEITGPVIEESASGEQKLVLITYFSIGFASATSEGKPDNWGSIDGNKPEEFRGDRNKYKSFVSQLALIFGANPHRMRSDKAKIHYAASYLRGPAFEWLEPFINELDGDIIFKTYPEFLEGLKGGFADPDEYATAEKQIENLVQKTSCSAYYSQFVALLAQLQWTEDAVKIHHFRKGLKNQIKDLLVGRDMPTKMSEFAALCIKLDNQIEARAQERRDNKPFRPPGNSYLAPPFQNLPPPPSQSAPKPSQLPVGEPMELDSAARQAFRKANNLCTYCGKTGHWVKDCEKALKRSVKVAAGRLADHLDLQNPETSSLYETKNYKY